MLMSAGSVGDDGISFDMKEKKNGSYHHIFESCSVQVSVHG